MTIWWGKCGWYMSNDFFDTKFDQILGVKMIFAMTMWQSWKDQQVAPLAVTCLNPPPSAGSQSWPPGQDGVIPPRLKMQVTIKIGMFRNLSPGQNSAPLLQNRPESSRPRRNTSHPLSFPFSSNCIMHRKLWFTWFTIDSLFSNRDQRDSRFSRILENCFSFSLLILDLETFQFHFHFSKKSEGILFFTFHFSKKVKAIRISLFFLE